VANLDLERAVRERAVIYAGIRAADSVKLAGDVARLLSNAFACAVMRLRQPSLLFVDEAQNWLSDSVATDFEAGRGFGLSHLLLLQEIEQARPMKGRHLGQIASNLCGWSLKFTANSADEVRAHSLDSGETEKVVVTTSESESHKLGEWPTVTRGTTRRTIREPVLDINAILAASADPTSFFYRQGDVDDAERLLGRVVIVKGIYPYTLEEYRRMEAAPWPAGPVLPAPELPEPEKKPSAIDRVMGRGKGGGGKKGGGKNGSQQGGNPMPLPAEAVPPA
jgi:hypothetical protein